MKLGKSIKDKVSNSVYYSVSNWVRDSVRDSVYYSVRNSVNNWVSNSVRVLIPKIKPWN